MSWDHSTHLHEYFNSQQNHYLCLAHENYANPRRQIQATWAWQQHYTQDTWIWQPRQAQTSVPNPSIMGLATKPHPSAMGLEQHQTQAILV
jgi:hypothetical protein